MVEVVVIPDVDVLAQESSPVTPPLSAESTARVNLRLTASRVTAAATAAAAEEAARLTIKAARTASASWRKRAW